VDTWVKTPKTPLGPRAGQGEFFTINSDSSINLGLPLHKEKNKCMIIRHLIVRSAEKNVH